MRARAAGRVVCGTRAGFAWHLLAGGEPCRECELAEQRYQDAADERIRRPRRQP